MRKMYKVKTKKDFVNRVGLLHNPVLWCQIGESPFLSHYWKIECDENIKIELPGCRMSWREYVWDDDSHHKNYFDRFNRLETKYKRWMYEVFGNNYRYVCKFE